MADIYCDSTGDDGSGTGAWDDPYATFQKAIDEASGGDTVRVGDTSAHTLSAEINWSSFGGGTSNTNYLNIVGWSVAGGEGAIGLPTIDGDNAIATTFSSTSRPSYVTIDSIKFANCTAQNVVASNWWNLIRCESADAGTVGLSITSGGKAIGCYIHGSGTYGIQMSTGSKVTGCWIQSSGTYAIYENQADSSISDCVIICNNGEDGIYYRSDYGQCINNTIVGDGTASQVGITTSSLGQGIVLTNNLVTDFDGTSAIGIEVTSGGSVAVSSSNQFYNNTTDWSGDAPKLQILADSTADPAYVNVAAHNYTPGAFLSGLSYDEFSRPTDSNRVIGAVQQAGGGGSTVLSQTLHGIESGIAL